MTRDPIQHLENLTKRTHNYMGAKTQGTLSRYPLVFSFLTVFGIVSIIYGFESFISHIPFLSDNPLLIFLLGVVILLSTGTLYKSLDRNPLE